MTDTVWLEKEKLCYIDQTRLPAGIFIKKTNRQKEIFEAIKNLEIRGAPAIGVGAAIGLYACCAAFEERTAEGFIYSLKQTARLFASARPTARNLFWALDRMLLRAEKYTGTGTAGLKRVLKKEALDIYAHDIEVCRKIGENGFELIKNLKTVLTHCNAGRLAAVRYGTALAPVYIAQEKGVDISVYADETRPLLQGARLTAYELAESGVDVTLICDGASAFLMSKGGIGAVLTGCDRVAANGDAANKIGTLNAAIAAKRYSVPFYVCAPFSTIDFSIADGGGIVVEERGAEEITDYFFKEKITRPGVKAYNPAFDITPAELITAFITEEGVFAPGELKWTANGN